MTATAADRINNYFGLNQASIKKIEYLGNNFQIIVPASTLFYSLYKKDYIGFSCLALTLIVNQIAIEVLKRLIPEKRPNGHRLSFPSGHTMATACGLSSLISRYGSSTPPIFVMAQSICLIEVGMSRIISKAHWVHDVVAGAFFGTLIGSYLVPRFQ